ncbi:MAG: hypothetical protein QXH75_00575 [Sulfolobaceae archaeon]
MKIFPFYRVENIFIDAYFMDKLAKPYLRILLVKTNLVNQKEGELINPLSFDTIIDLLKDGYNNLNSIKVNKEKINILDSILSSLYNPGYYLRKRKEEITLSSLYRIYQLAYKVVLDKLQKRPPYDIIYSTIILNDNQILINGKIDEVYTKLFNHDEGFRKAILSLLSEQLHK